MNILGNKYDLATVAIGRTILSYGQMILSQGIMLI